MKTKNNPKILMDSSSPEERRGFFKKFGAFVAAAAAAGGFANLKAKNTYSGTEISSFMTATPYLGSIGLFAGNFAVRQWALCAGQLLAISQFDALFSILGTIYGGDGRTTFGLPDLRGRTAIGEGTGPGLSPRPLGQKSGEEYHTLTVLEMPSHTHTHTYTPPNYEMMAYTGRGTLITNPDDAALAKTSAGNEIYSDAAGTTAMGATSIKEKTLGVVSLNFNGGSQSHDNMQPFLGVYYQIALYGIYPPRN